VFKTISKIFLSRNMQCLQVSGCLFFQFCYCNQTNVFSFSDNLFLHSILFLTISFITYRCRDDKTANFISINNEETTCLSLANFAKSKREFWCEKLDNAQSYCPATCGTCIWKRQKLFFSVSCPWVAISVNLLLPEHRFFTISSDTPGYKLFSDKLCLNFQSSALFNSPARENPTLCVLLILCMQYIERDSDEFKALR